MAVQIAYYAFLIVMIVAAVFAGYTAGRGQRNRTGDYETGRHKGFSEGVYFVVNVLARICPEMMDEINSRVEEYIHEKE